MGHIKRSHLQVRLKSLFLRRTFYALALMTLVSARFTWLYETVDD